MIEVSRETGLWVLTLNRPDKANSVTRAMLAALADAVDEARAAGVAALVLTGVGKVFSAGADLQPRPLVGPARPPFHRRAALAGRPPMAC